MKRPVRWRGFSQVVLLGVLVVAEGACQSFPPAITGIAIYPTDAHGVAQGDDMCRTWSRPPIPVIGVRPGADPGQSAMFLNEPLTGQIAVTLARGIQNFLLYTSWLDPSDHLVIAIYLDHADSPALSTVVNRQTPGPLVANRAPSTRGMDGEPVANHAALSVVHGGYRIALLRAEFPLPTTRIDTLSPWLLVPDNVADSVGLITIEVQPVAH